MFYIMKVRYVYYDEIGPYYETETYYSKKVGERREKYKEIMIANNVVKVVFLNYKNDCTLIEKHVMYERKQYEQKNSSIYDGLHIE